MSIPSRRPAQHLGIDDYSPSSDPNAAGRWQWPAFPVSLFSTSGPKGEHHGSPEIEAAPSSRDEIDPRRAHAAGRDDNPGLDLLFDGAVGGDLGVERRVWLEQVDEPDKISGNHAQMRRLALVGQVSHCLAAGWEPRRTMRLALRAVMAGIAGSSGAHVGLSDGSGRHITVVDAVGWCARNLKGCEVALADLLRAKVMSSGTATKKGFVVIGSGSHGDRLPLVAGGMHFFAAPLSVQGTITGLLGFSRGGPLELDADEATFLGAMADLVATATANAHLRSEVAERTREAAVLEELDLHVLQGMPFTRALCVLAKAARELTRSNGASIALLNADRQSQTRLVVLGAVTRALRERQIPMRRGLHGWVMEHCQPTFSNDLLSDPRVDAQTAQVFREVALHSGANAPMLINGQFVGYFAVYNRLPHEGRYARRDAGLLARLATHASEVIEKASLSDRYRHSPLARTLIWQMMRERRRGSGDLAIAEERARIARSLHDGLAQQLTGLNIGLQLIEQMVADPVSFGPEEVHRELAGIRQTARDIFNEVRTCISKLDTQLKCEEDFVEELAKTVRQFAAGNGIQARLDLCADRAKLPPLLGLRLLQIAEEALANIKKHARASQVAVILSVTDQQLELTISDDGRGFNYTRSSKGHFGLGMMRARAEEIGARFVVSAQRGRGTSVQVTLPLAAAGG